MSSTWAWHAVKDKTVDTIGCIPVSARRRRVYSRRAAAGARAHPALAAAGLRPGICGAAGARTTRRSRLPFQSQHDCCPDRQRVGSPPRMPSGRPAGRRARLGARSCRAASRYSWCRRRACTTSGAALPGTLQAPPARVRKALAARGVALDDERPGVRGRCGEHAAREGQR